MIVCKPVFTTIETQQLITATLDYQPDEQFYNHYQSSIGLLIYAILGTWPDIAFMVSVISRYSFKLNDSH